jgi:hypothetical protein
LCSPGPQISFALLATGFLTLLAIVGMIPSGSAHVAGHARDLGVIEALTHTRSFLPMNRKVVLTQGRSSAPAAAAPPRRPTIPNRAISPVLNILLLSRLLPEQSSAG